MTPERQRKIDAMAVIMRGEGFHYIKEEIEAIVEGFFRGYRNAETQAERHRCCDDAFRIERFWKHVKLKLADIKKKATKPETENATKSKETQWQS